MTELKKFNIFLYKILVHYVQILSKIVYKFWSIVNFSNFNEFHITPSNYNYTVILQEFSMQLRCTYNLCRQKRIIKEKRRLK